MALMNDSIENLKAHSLSSGMYLNIQTILIAHKHIEDMEKVVNPLSW